MVDRLSVNETFINYYITRRGENPISKFINSLNHIQRAKIRRTFLVIRKYGLEAASPHIKKLKETPFWEVRALGKDNIRILCAINQNILLILHGFIKKSQKTPRKEIVTAVNRYQEWKEDNRRQKIT